MGLLAKKNGQVTHDLPDISTFQGVAQQAAPRELQTASATSLPISVQPTFVPSPT